MGKKISASQAAKRVGKSVPTISRAIKSGKLSAEPNPDGGWLIDPSELARVWGDTPATGDVKCDTLQRETAMKPSDVRVLEVQIEAKDEIISELRRQIEGLETDRNEWRQQAQTLALTDQRQQERSTSAPMQEAQKSPVRGFWSIFGGRGRAGA